MGLEKIHNLPYFKSPYEGPIQHDFLGESHLIDGKWVRQGRFSAEDFICLEIDGRVKRWTEAITSISESWDKIPQAEEVRQGDLIIYKLDGKIPNIHSSPTHTITAYPVKVDSIKKGKDGISSIAITETRFTSFRNPFETYNSYGGNTKAILKMRQAGYLRDEKMTITAENFRLFDDVNHFLAEEFNLELPKMPQEFEPIFGNF